MHLNAVRPRTGPSLAGGLSRSSPPGTTTWPTAGAGDDHAPQAAGPGGTPVTEVARGDPAEQGLCAPLPRWGEAPDGHGFVGLIHAFFSCGGTLEAAVVDRLLKACGRGLRGGLADGVSGGVSGGLSRLLATRQVFGFEWRDTLWIPMFQFNPDDLSVRPGSQRVRDELPVLWSGWNQACWFASPNHWLGGRTPVEMIDAAPRDLEEAARAWRPQRPCGPESAARAQGSAGRGFD
jgi:hypothetical protein